MNDREHTKAVVNDPDPKGKRRADVAFQRSTGSDNGGEEKADKSTEPQSIEETAPAKGAESKNSEEPGKKVARKKVGVKGSGKIILPERWTVKRLLTEELPIPRWLVDGLIPEGLTLLVGAPKTGKSWFALNLASAFGTAGRALGQRQVERAETLYLALEDTPQRLKGRVESLGIPRDAALSFILRRDWTERGAVAIDRLNHYLDAYPDTKVIIIDTLERIRLGGVSERGGYALDVAELAHLAGLLDRGVSVLALHHDRKGGRGADILDRVSGTKGITGTADTILILDKNRDDGKAELYVTGRDVADTRLALAFNGEVGSWVELGNAWEYQENNNKQAIIDALKKAGSPLSPAILTEMTGIKHNHIKQLVIRMVVKGDLEKAGRGAYVLNTGQTELDSIPQEGGA